MSFSQGKQPSYPSREASLHLFEDEKQQGVFICTWYTHSQSTRALLLKDLNKISPVRTIRQICLGEKVDAYVLLSTGCVCGVGEDQTLH